MRITIKATGFELTEALRAYIEQKVGGLSKFIASVDDSAVAAVEVAKTTAHHKSGDIYQAEINLTRAGSPLIREVVVDKDLYTAIDHVKDHIAETMANARHKKVSLIRKGGRALKNMIRGFRA